MFTSPILYPDSDNIEFHDDQILYLTYLIDVKYRL